MNRYVGVLFTEGLEFAVVPYVLVEKIAGNDQLVNFQVGQGLEDIGQRVKPRWLIFARGQVNIRCYRDLQGANFLWLVPCLTASWALGLKVRRVEHGGDSSTPKRDGSTNERGWQRGQIPYLLVEGNGYG